MSNNQNSQCFQLKRWISLTILGVFAFSEDAAFAQVIRDNTLGTENTIVTPQLINNQPINQIDGGAIRGTNLFHSFEQFSIPTGSTVYFNNAANIQNIISRVTGNSTSNIDGILRANGNANLFLINPNGIVFGPNATLNIGGSFVASTASSVNFADGTKFNATTPQTTPLLTVSLPIGLQFGTTANTIRNQSQASPGGARNSLNAPVGLQVSEGKTLALVGGDLSLEGGNLTAKAGRIELASVAPNSFVSFNPINEGWSLGYQDVRNFQNIQLIGRNQIPASVDVSGEGAGNIQVQGRRLLLTDGGRIVANTLGSKAGGDLTVNAADSVELLGLGTALLSRTESSGKASNLTVNTGKLIVRDGGQIITSTSGSGMAGKLTVNASDAVEILGGFNLQFPRPGFILSALFSATNSTGDASETIINTRKLIIEGGARISTQSTGLFLLAARRFIPATGNGGDLIINASESVELRGKSTNNALSGLFTSTQGPGNAGNLILNTEKLTIRDEATITSSSTLSPLAPNSNLGKAGELNINARSVVLNNQGQLTSQTDFGQGGNINLQVQDILLLRRQSQISTSAGRAKGGGDGGNITINTPNGFIVAPASENSDITANAFSGGGGKIIITATNIFGLKPRTRDDLVAQLQTNDPNQLDPTKLPTSDITAFSQQNPLLSGTVQINTPEVDSSKGLVEVSVNLDDASRQIFNACNPGEKFRRASFVYTGRGGIIFDPTDLSTNTAVLADWIDLQGNSNLAENSNLVVNSDRTPNPTATQNNNNVNIPEQIIEAQGWVVDAQGRLKLVAHAPTLMPQSCMAGQ
jgi:filamentous hemagglutinin family protein